MKMYILYDSIDKSKALAFLVHCADISHPAKSWKLHSRWTDLLVEEFFKQVTLPFTYHFTMFCALHKYTF